MHLRKDRKAERQKEAIWRNEAWRELSVEEQIKSLKQRRGNSRRQLTKLEETQCSTS